MGDNDINVQASDSEILLVQHASPYEALEDVVAVESERVVRVMDLVGLQIDLTAGTEESQAELVRLGTSSLLLLRWRLVAGAVSIVKRSDVPGHGLRVCGVEVLLDLRFGGTLDAGGVGELEGVVAVDVVVVTVILEYVHYLAPTDEVVDSVLEFLR